MKQAFCSEVQVHSLMSVLTFGQEVENKMVVQLTGLCCHIFGWLLKCTGLGFVPWWCFLPHTYALHPLSWSWGVVCWNSLVCLYVQAFPFWQSETLSKCDKHHDGASLRASAITSVKRSDCYLSCLEGPGWGVLTLRMDFCAICSDLLNH